MSLQQKPSGSCQVEVENIGGITETSVEFTPGVTVLTGENATNRTSFLQALMAVSGSDDFSLKTDTDKGSVVLSMAGERYTRDVERKGKSVLKQGDPVLSDPVLADLFAFLLGTNEARQAVLNEDDLREIIMQPVDTNEIRNEIENLTRKKENIKNDIDAIDSVRQRLPELKRQSRNLEDEIAEKQETLEEKRAEFSEKNTDTVEQDSELDQKLAEVQRLRTKREELQTQLDAEKEGLNALNEEHSTLIEEEESISEVPESKVTDLEQQINELQSRKQKINAEINKIQGIIQFNNEMLEGQNLDTLSNLQEEENSSVESITDQLVGDETITCWTCETEVQRKRIESTIEELKTISDNKVTNVESIEEEISELREEKNELREQQRRRQQLEQQIREVTTEIEDSEENIETLEEEVDVLSTDIEEIENEIKMLEEEEQNEEMEKQKEINEIEFEIDQLQDQLADVQEEISNINDRVAERDSLEQKRDELQSDIKDLRTRVSRIEKEAVDEFNTHMDEIIDILRYENLERVWLERQEKHPDGPKISDSQFVLHVVRENESGATYEDSLHNLSESEREVVGLIFALAGYLVHDVHETVPFMLLDSLESIDSNRINEIVSYFEGFAEYLIVVLLPEDAAALPDKYPRIRDI